MFRFFLFALAIAASPLAAQSLEPGPTITIEGKYFTVETPTPAWNRDGLAEKFEDAGTTERGIEVEIFELIPPGESFDDWSQIWALFSEHGLDGDLEGYKSAVLANYVPSCGEAATAGPVLARAETYEVFIIPCPSNPFRPGTGQVSVMYIAYNGYSWTRLYQEIKTPEFSDSEMQAIAQAVDPHIDLFLRMLPEFSLSVRN